MAETAPRRPAALELRPGESALHRMRPRSKLALAGLVGAAALALPRLDALVPMALLLIVAYRTIPLGVADLWRDTRWLLLQGCVVVALTVALRGPDAWLAGLRTALQILLFFLPIALVLRTTPSEALVADARRWLPDRLAFALGACVRFLPFFAREAGDLIAAQRMRGARLSAAELWHPGAWRDWLDCFALPMLVRAIRVAHEAAEAAEIRGLSPLEEE